MRIDGSNLKSQWGLSFLNSTQSGSGIPGAPSIAQDDAQDNTGFDLKISGTALPPPPGLEGVFENAQAATTTPSTMTELVQDMGEPESTSDAFALEMARRMQGQVDENGEAKDVTALASAMSNAVEWIRDQHGDMTANSVMATVLGATGDAATEQSVSDGLVKALQLVDAQHGIEAGDATIAKFNGDLNRELNAYYDNGADEEFLASTTTADGTTLTNGTMTSRFTRELVEEAAGADTEQSLTEQLLEEMASELEEATSPEALSEAWTQKALDAYSYTAQPEPQLLSVSA